MNDQQTPACKDEQQRKADLLANPNLNGIDYVEVDPANHAILRVFFLKPVPPANAANPADPDDAYGIHANLNSISIAGGVRIVGIKPVSATRQPDGSLIIQVNQGGDYSTYALGINVSALDPFLSRVLFSFMASCPVDFDCRQVQVCPPPALQEPALDYMAKDYSSFRRMLLDLLPQLNPKWNELNPSDLGIALLELLAYCGDNLSYFQDAVANEAFLETVRQRISARRHTRLIDYHMHDGRNAWTWIYVRVSAAASLSQGAKVLTRISSHLAGQTFAPGVLVDDAKITADSLAADPALSATVVYETTQPAAFDPANNEIAVHSWGDHECCLKPGTTEVFLYSLSGSTAVRPALAAGMSLLLEEVKGPLTGAAADADPAQRQVVFVTGVAQTEDPLYSNVLVNGALQRWQTGDTDLPLLRVSWAESDALTFPFCLSVRLPDIGLVSGVTVARGNLVLADHGLTTSETLAPDGNTPVRLQLSHGPLTMQCQPASVEYDATTGRLATPRPNLTCDVRQVQPAISLMGGFPNGPELWTPVPDLLDSTPFDQSFVAEIDDNGIAHLRFGDGEYGRDPSDAISFQAVYRIGNGRSGNVGADSIAHMALSGPANWLVAVRNPLPARGGVDPETIEEARQHAPEAFRAEQFRAVTEADYAAAARKLPDVADAVAAFRWTGSWYTVYVGIDPRNESDLIQQPNGRNLLSATLEQEVLAYLNHYRLAGYDMEIRPPDFVPLELDIQICTAPGYFREDVGHAVAEALGPRGFFNPANFSFGQPVFLSQIYAAAERVEGVDSAVITLFRRFGQPDNQELANGVLTTGPWEIAQLENDPNFMEHGVLRITALGGKA